MDRVIYMYYNGHAEGGSAWARVPERQIGPWVLESSIQLYGTILPDELVPVVDTRTGMIYSNTSTILA